MIHMVAHTCARQSSSLGVSLKIPMSHIGVTELSDQWQYLQYDATNSHI